MSEGDLEISQCRRTKYKSAEEAKQAKVAYMYDYIRAYYQKNKEKFYTPSDGSKKNGRPRLTEDERIAREQIWKAKKSSLAFILAKM